VLKRDAETAAILDELSGLQTWATLLMARSIPKAREAYDLIQRTRIFIIERSAHLTAPEQENDDDR
jgi:hypothetical protein